MNPSMSSFGHNTSHRGYNLYNNTLVFRGGILDLGEALDALEKIRVTCGGYVLIR